MGTVRTYVEQLITTVLRTSVLFGFYREPRKSGNQEIRIFLIGNYSSFSVEILAVRHFKHVE